MVSGPNQSLRAATPRISILQSLILHVISASAGWLWKAVCQRYGAATLLLLTSFFCSAQQSMAQVYAVGSQSNLPGPWSQAASSTGPVGVATDSLGNIYIGQHLDQSIIKINASTRATTVFATTCGAIQLGNIQYMVVDAAGTLYVADGTNSAIFAFSTASGLCTAHFSAGGDAPFGVAVDSSNNLFYTTFPLAPDHAVGVFEIPAGSQTGIVPTPVITTGLSYPTGVAFDPASGDMLVADQETGNVLKYTLSSGFNASSATTYLTGLNQPYGVFFDASKNLLVSETGANTVLRYSYPGYVNPVEMTPYIGSASGIGQDPGGNYYVTGYTAHTVTEFSSNFGQTPVSTSSSSLAVNFNIAAGTTVGGFRYLGGGVAGQEFAPVNADLNPYLCTLQTYGSTQTCSLDVLFAPTFSGMRSGAVQVLDASGDVLATAYLQGTGVAAQVNFLPGVQKLVAADLSVPEGIAVDGAGKVYIADTNNNRVLAETLSGGGYVASAITTSALNDPVGMAVDGGGSLYIADSGNNRILKETPAASGFVESVISTTVSRPLGIALDGKGNLYIADQGSSRILKEALLIDGSYSESPVVTGSALSGPQDVAVDAVGNVYIADTDNRRALLETLQQNGSYVESIIDSVSFESPDGIKVDVNGNVYVADQESGAVTKETLSTGSYTPSTVAFSGVTSPQGLAFDSNGNLYVADQGSAQALKLDLSDAPALAFPSTPIDQASTSQTITLLNAGNTALLLPIGSSGSNPAVSSNFALNTSQTDACFKLPNARLDQNSGCLLAVSFTPTVSGSITGSLVLTDSNLASSSSAIQSLALSGTGLAAVATKLAVSGLPATITAGGNPGVLTATLEDADGNLVTTSSALVTVTITGPGGYSKAVTATAVHGVATLDLSSFVIGPGTYTVTTSSPGIASTVSTLTVTMVISDLPAGITISSIPAMLANGGNLGEVTATIKDANGNTVAGAAVTITAVLSGPGGYSKSVTAVTANGIASIDLSSFPLTAAGTYTLVISTPGLPAKTFSFAVAQGFALALTSGTGVTTSTQTVSVGQTASFSFTLSPGTGGFTNLITMSASGLPPGGSYIFSPATVTPGSGPTTTTLTIQTVLASAGLRQSAPGPMSNPGNHGQGEDLATVALGLLLLPFAGVRQWRKAAREFPLMLLPVLLLSFGIICGLAGCGSSPKSISPARQSYVVTVTATSGVIHESTNVTLIVQ